MDYLLTGADHEHNVGPQRPSPVRRHRMRGSRGVGVAATDGLAAAPGPAAVAPVPEERRPARADRGPFAKAHAQPRGAAL